MGITHKAKIASIVLAAAVIHPVVAQNQPAMLPTSEGLVRVSTVAAQSPFERNIVARFRVSVTAYSSDPAETDDTPFITASNTVVRDGIAAANFLPFGTRLIIPEVSGSKVYVVEDRMHGRFSDRVDIWMSEKAKARAFGIRRNVEIIVVNLPGDREL